jgi:hypothetical protein
MAFTQSVRFFQGASQAHDAPTSEATVRAGLARTRV